LKKIFFLIYFLLRLNGQNPVYRSIISKGGLLHPYVEKIDQLTRKVQM
jgi:hypothetical protein